jgi:predicted RNA binding protein YcfA (HicA-like mRNA interferase family)
MNGKQIIKTLEAHGWTLDRIEGSHHVMMNGPRAVPVPVHGANDLGIGLIKAIEKQTGVKLK